jgi:hypothetical protein
MMLYNIREQGEAIDTDYQSRVKSLYLHNTNDDDVIAVACIILEMENETREEGTPPREPTENDVFFAIDFIDHLDTLGKAIKPK